jgi:hypothetical protein
LPNVNPNKGEHKYLSTLKIGPYLNANGKGMINLPDLARFAYCYAGEKLQKIIHHLLSRYEHKITVKHIVDGGVKYYDPQERKTSQSHVAFELNHQINHSTKRIH